MYLGVACQHLGGMKSRVKTICGKDVWQCVYRMSYPISFYTKTTKFTGFQKFERNWLMGDMMKQGILQAADYYDLPNKRAPWNKRAPRKNSWKLIKEHLGIKEQGGKSQLF